MAWQKLFAVQSKIALDGLRSEERNFVLYSVQCCTTEFTA